MENELMQRLIERYLSAYNTFDIQGMLDVLDEDIRFLNAVQGEVLQLRRKSVFQKKGEKRVRIEDHS